MRKCELNFEDFKRAFEFGKNYYINPQKVTAGRTAGEPRGLGSVLDDFTLGKLTEVGVEKILTNINGNKKYGLDFDIKSTYSVRDAPDIIKIEEGGKERTPLVFVEIKNTINNGRWVDVKEEQFNTIKRSAKGKKIYMIYASIRSDYLENNLRTANLTGMFLKEIEDKSKSSIFQEFASLNAECEIEFILSSYDIDKFGFHFEAGMNMYETDFFDEKNRSSFYSKSGKRKDVDSIVIYEDFDSTLDILIRKDEGPEKEEIGKFSLKGSFKLIHKKKKIYIECLSDVFLTNDIFGNFTLEAKKYYDFNLKTIGRDPKLKRNNIFIAKRRIPQLLKMGELTSPEEYIKTIAEDI